VPAPSSSLISAVLGDLADLPACDRDALAGGIPQLLAHLAWVPDPRDPRGVRHSLVSLLATAVAAALTGATSFAAIAEWIADVPRDVLDAFGIRYNWFARAQEIPDEATLRAVLGQLDAVAFTAATGAWLKSLAGVQTDTEQTVAGPSARRPRREQVAVDGKALRGTITPAQDGPGTCWRPAPACTAWSWPRSRSMARPTNCRRSNRCCGRWT
jgi:DDE_Tnp_1-associated